MPRDKRIWIVAAAALIAVVALIAAAVPGKPTMRVIFFDVGDGECTLIRTPSGKSLLIDCGTSSWRNPADVGSKLIAPYLRSQGISRIDAVVLSHPHSDHMSGIPSLLRDEPAGLVMDSGEERQTPEYISFLRAIRKTHARYRKLRLGQKIDMGDGVVAEVLGPVSMGGADLNDESIVLRVGYKRTAVLLEADAGEPEEASMIASGTDLRTQVLQVGHHGSAHATSPQFLADVRPAIAVISCSSHSRYGFPSQRVLDRLSSFGVRTYTTGRSGAVTVTSDGANMSVSTLKETP